MKKMASLLLLAAAMLLAACQGTAAPAATQTVLPSTVPPTPLATTAPPAAPPETLPTTPPEVYPYPVETSMPEPQSPELPAITPPAGPSAGDPLWMSYPPAPGDEALERGNFLLDALTVMSDTSTPGQVDLYVEGSLPTPCNEPRFIVNPPDDQNRIVVELYTLVSTQEICVQMIQPFYERIGSLSGLPSGEYFVVHDGSEVATFTIP